jgi:hypothetical protein
MSFCQRYFRGYATVMRDDLNVYISRGAVNVA